VKGVVASIRGGYRGLSEGERDGRILDGMFYSLFVIFIDGKFASGKRWKF
jgi:hypothetical protein